MYAMSDSESDKSSESEDGDYMPSGNESEEEAGKEDNEEENVLEDSKESEAQKKKADEAWESFKKETSVREKKPEIKDKKITKETVTVTKVYDFAGEEVKVIKEIAANSNEAKALPRKVPATDTTPLGRLKRSGGGGIHSVLGKLGKKQKLSTLEKSKLDWQNFKEEKGIHEELNSYKKGKDGYLEKQSFLERTDMRQFEKERDVRLGRTSNSRR